MKSSLSSCKCRWSGLFSLALLSVAACQLTGAELERNGRTASATKPAGPLANRAVAVRPVLGVPTFTVADEAFTIPCFETYVPEQRYFEQFAKAGCKLFMFNTNAAACDYGHSKPTWLAPDTWDYSNFDERMNRVLAADPNAMVIPRLNMGTPRWWLDQNPEEMEILDHGSSLYETPNRNPTLPKDRPFPSLASAKWRQDLGMAIRKLVEHIREAGFEDHIFGYCLSGLDTEEWYHWSSGSDQLAGYSPLTRRAFQAWLKEKYQTVEVLRHAWNCSDTDFENASVPSRAARYDLGQGTLRDPAAKMDVIDFYQFYNEMVPETVDYFAGILREATQGKKAIGAFYAYMYEFRGDPEYGHNALAKFNESPNIDFVFVTASYHNRAPGKGGDYARSPAYSLRLHGKLWYHDNDVVSFLAPEVLRRAGFSESADWSTNLNHHLEVLGYTPTVEQTQWMYRRSLGFALGHGIYESYFDLHGGYYDHPELMAEVAGMNRAADDSRRFDRSSLAEILVVSDELSCAYATFRSDLLETSLLSSQAVLIKIGAPADHVLLSDLHLLPCDRYKFVVFLNCYHMTDDQRRVIHEKLLNKGRHVMWCYAPGYFNGCVRSAEAMRDLTGMRLVVSEDARFVAPRIELRECDFGPVQASLRGGVSTVGPEEKCCGLISVDDTSTMSMGFLPGTNQVTMAVKRIGDWTSIYSITPTVAPALYRELAKAAGVHVFNDRDDTLYASRSYLTIHANGDGLRTIRFPRRCNVVDVMDQKAVARDVDEMKRTFRDGETVILRWAGTP